MFEKAIYYQLVNSIEIEAYINTRAYPMRAPKGAALPYVVFQTISDVSDHTLAEGASGAAEARVQIDCYADNYADAKGLADMVRYYFDAQKWTAEGETVLGAFMDDASDGLIETADQDEMGIKRVTMDFMVWHEQATVN